jgi:hypothetical protein
LDAAYLGPGGGLAADLGGLELHDSWCAEADGSGSVLLIDERDPQCPLFHHYR